MTRPSVLAGRSGAAHRVCGALGRWLGVLVVGALFVAAPAAAEPSQGATLAESPRGIPLSEPPAPAKYHADVLVLHATNSKKGIDKRIGDMPELTRPPFSSYDSYALIDRQRLPLEKGTPRRLKLPNRRVLETKLLGVLDAEHVRLAASINQPGGEDFLPLLEVKAKVGQPFIVAGQSYKNGILVLVIRVVR